MKQLSLLPKPNPVCDGQINGKRKPTRTIVTRSPMHLILKAEKEISLFATREDIRLLINRQAEIFQVKIYTWSIQHDHIHISAKFPSRECYMKFIRALSGLLARKFKVKFKKRPFTRVVHWGKDFRNLNDYIFRNEMEVFGVWKYRMRR